MKRRLFFAATIAASAIIGGATAFAISELRATDQQESSSYTSTTIQQSNNNTAGTHFTTYTQENYPDLTYAAENAVQGVVNIEVTQRVNSQGSSGGYNPFYDFFGIPQGYNQGGGQPQERKGGGSGVIISEDGYIVTNNHVIDKASEIKVKLNDGSRFDAKLIGTDPTTDVALIKIEAEDLPTVPFGDSDALRLGEWVMAIGSPYDLQNTITAGIVSAKARGLGAIPSDFSIESFIQTDAAVNPGNSGGALVNTKGQLVGINTVIKSPTGSFAGYSFAVPSSIVERVVVDLKEFGVVQRALLGIRISDINDQLLDEYGDKFNIKAENGVVIMGLEETGAAKAAKLQEGDVIISINDDPIHSAAELQGTVAKYRPNDKIKVSVKRGDNVKHFDVVLRNTIGKAELLPKDYVETLKELGGEFASISDKSKKALDIKGGVQVTAVESGGVLQKAGVKKGFIITHINDIEINSVNDINQIRGSISSIEGAYPNGRFIRYALVQ